METEETSDPIHRLLFEYGIQKEITHDPRSVRIFGVGQYRAGKILIRNKTLVGYEAVDVAAMLDYLCPAVVLYEKSKPIGTHIKITLKGFCNRCV